MPAKTDEAQGTGAQGLQGHRGTGHRAQDTGHRTQDTGHRTQDTGAQGHRGTGAQGHRAQGTGHRAQGHRGTGAQGHRGTGHRAQGTGHTGRSPDAAGRGQAAAEEDLPAEESGEDVEEIMGSSETVREKNIPSVSCFRTKRTEQFANTDSSQSAHSLRHTQSCGKSLRSSLSSYCTWPTECF